MIRNGDERHWHERRLGRTIIRAYRDSVDLYDVVPNPRQPRMGPKDDPELQRQIEANEGLWQNEANGPSGRVSENEPNG